MSERTGFFEESPGVFSMTRVVMLLQALGVLALTLALSGYLLRSTPPESGVIAALGVPLVALATGLWSSTRERA